MMSDTVMQLVTASNINGFVNVLTLFFSLSMLVVLCPHCILNCMFLNEECETVLLLINTDY